MSSEQGMMSVHNNITHGWIMNGELVHNEKEKNQLRSSFCSIGYQEQHTKINKYCGRLSIDKTMYDKIVQYLSNGGTHI